MEDTKEKRFVGLDGLKRFWTKAKTWIAGQITAEVTAKIAEIVANAPGDLDTLKEIADWIKNHENDASAMNTAILANTEAISGKADTGHTHDDRYFTETEVANKLDSIKTFMKPNYTTGRLPAGVYSGGKTVSMSASITTTRGNPVFISYFGDFNSYGSGDTVPWISFNLYADDQLLQRTVVDNSVASNSDNTSFAGGALAVLSAGSHTIRLDAVLTGGSSGQIHFQEQENCVNLVAFEL